MDLWNERDAQAAPRDAGGELDQRRKVCRRADGRATGMTASTRWIAGMQQGLPGFQVQADRRAERVRRPRPLLLGARPRWRRQPDQGNGFCRAEGRDGIKSIASSWIRCQQERRCRVGLASVPTIFAGAAGYPGVRLTHRYKSNYFGNLFPSAASNPNTLLLVEPSCARPTYRKSRPWTPATPNWCGGRWPATRRRFAPSCRRTTAGSTG